jgi:hypothetical protein
MDEIIDELSHAFLLEKIKRELQHIRDPETLIEIALSLVDLIEKQKACFKNLMWKLIDENPEKPELFE